MLMVSALWACSDIATRLRKCSSFSYPPCIGCVYSCLMTHGCMGRINSVKWVLSCNPRCPCWAIGSLVIGGTPHLVDFGESKLSCFELVTCSTRSLAARWLRKVIRCANQVMSNGTFYIRPSLKRRCGSFLGGSGFWQFQNHWRPKKWCFNPLSKVDSYATCIFLPLHRFNLESCAFGRLNQSIFGKTGVWRTFTQTQTPDFDIRITNINFFLHYPGKGHQHRTPHSWTPPTFWSSDWLYFMTIARKHVLGCSPVTSCKGFFYVLNGPSGMSSLCRWSTLSVWYGMGGGLRVSQTRAAISGGVGHGNPKLPAKALPYSR